MGRCRLSRVMRMGGMWSMIAEKSWGKNGGELRLGIYFHGTYDRHDCVLTSFLRHHIILILSKRIYIFSFIFEPVFRVLTNVRYGGLCRMVIRIVH